MTTIRERRPPPPFRQVEVSRVEQRSPYMTRVTVAGSDLSGFDPGLPAASLRLLLPTQPGELSMPTWRGNEFLLDDGSRPVIRTLTPLRFDPGLLELDFDIVRHDHGPLSAWAGGARVGNDVAISGTGRGYEIDRSAQSFLLAGDESALPALGTVLQALRPEAQVHMIIEVRHSDARLELPVHPNVTTQWLRLDESSQAGDALVAAVASAQIGLDTRVWAAGEAAAMQRVRRHLLNDRGVPRSAAVVRGYWKHGR